MVSQVSMLLGYIMSEAGSSTCWYIIRVVQQVWLADTVWSGGRDSTVARMSDSLSKGCVFESRQERKEYFLLQSYLSVLILSRYPFYPRVTAVTRKRPRSFCQKCRWEVTPKQAYTQPTNSEWVDYAV